MVEQRAAAGSGGQRLRVMACISDGRCQHALVRAIAARHELVGIVLEHEPGDRGTLAQRLARYLRPDRALDYLRVRAFAGAYRARGEAAWRKHYAGTEPGLPAVPTLRVRDINAEAVLPWLAQHAPEVVVVNGTRLLRRRVRKACAALRHGAINLHTGLSPYARGGNCNLWVLLERRPEEVGVTVHYIDGGIDRGDLLLTDQVPLEAGDCYESIDVRTFARGEQLVLEALDLLAQGRAPRVPQWTPGRLYRQRDGHVYSPATVLRLNRRLERGALREFIAQWPARSAHIQLVRAADA